MFSHQERIDLLDYETNQAFIPGGIYRTFDLCG